MEGGEENVRGDAGACLHPGFDPYDLEGLISKRGVEYVLPYDGGSGDTAY